MVRVLAALVFCLIAAAPWAEAAFISPTIQFNGFDKSWETTYVVQPGDPFTYLNVCVTVIGAPAGSTLLLDGLERQCEVQRFGGLSMRIRAPSDFVGAVELTFVVTQFDFGFEITRRTFGGFVPPPPPPPPARTLRLRAAFVNLDLESATFAPPAGVPVPVNASVPLGAVVAFEAIDSDGNSVPANFALGTAELSPDVDPDALFPTSVLHYFLPPAPNLALLQATHLGNVSVAVTPSDTSLAGGVITVSVERPSALGTSGASVDIDVVEVAHRTGVPPPTTSKRTCGRNRCRSGTASPIGMSQSRRSATCWRCRGGPT